jgi:hypothetical protein
LGLILALLSQPVAQVFWLVADQEQLPRSTAIAISVCAYLAVVLTLSFRTARRRCSAVAWGKKINEMSQVLHSGSDGATLEQVLRFNRIRLTIVDSATQTVLVLLAVGLTWMSTVPGTLLPIALPLVFGAAILAEQGRTVWQQLRGVLVLRTSVVPTADDLPPARHDDTDAREMSTWKKVSRRFLQIALTVIALLWILASILDGSTVWEAVRGWLFA